MSICQRDKQRAAQGSTAPLLQAERCMVTTVGEVGAFAIPSSLLINGKLAFRLVLCFWHHNKLLQQHLPPIFNLYCVSNENIMPKDLKTNTGVGSEPETLTSAVSLEMVLQTCSCSLKSDFLPAVCTLLMVPLCFSLTQKPLTMLRSAPLAAS